MNFKKSKLWVRQDFELILISDRADRFVETWRGVLIRQVFPHVGGQTSLQTERRASLVQGIYGVCMYIYLLWNPKTSPPFFYYLTDITASIILCHIAVRAKVLRIFPSEPVVLKSRVYRQMLGWTTKCSHPAHQMNSRSMTHSVTVTELKDGLEKKIRSSTRYRATHSLGAINSAADKMCSW